MEGHRVIRIRPRIISNESETEVQARRWADRLSRPPAPGTLRLFDAPTTVTDDYFVQYFWERDRTLTEIIREIESYRDASGNSDTVSFMPDGYAAELERTFAAVQRSRWLARKVLMHWTQRVWRQKPQCNIDLIEMSPIAETDAVYVTDTKIHQVYRFHRRDVFNTLLSNICMCDDMLPNPRPPANPFTNAPLRLPQIISVCEQLCRYYGTLGRCPPTLFAAFCASHYDLTRFREENASLLSQHAITAFFKEHSVENEETVIDTMLQIISEAGRVISPNALRRWLRTGPRTPEHGAWLHLVRDYTLYINLHIQVRSHWHSPLSISADVRRLYDRTTFPDAVSVRVRQLREGAREILRMPNQSHIGTWSIPFLLQPPPPPPDVSGGATSNDEDVILQLIQNALFRL